MTLRDITFFECACKRAQVVACERLRHLRIHGHGETMERTKVYMQFGGHTRANQAARILDILFQEQVQRTDSDEGWCEAREALGACGGCVR